MLMVPTLKVRAYSAIFHCRVEWIPGCLIHQWWHKNYFVTMLDNLNWHTSLASHRSQSFILLPQMSTAKPTIFHGGSTSRINLCISEIFAHKDGAKCHLSTKLGFQMNFEKNWSNFIYLSVVIIFETNGPP